MSRSWTRSMSTQDQDNMHGQIVSVFDFAYMYISVQQYQPVWKPWLDKNALVWQKSRSVRLKSDSKHAMTTSNGC